MDSGQSGNPGVDVVDIRHINDEQHRIKSRVRQVDPAFYRTARIRKSVKMMPSLSWEEKVSFMASQSYWRTANLPEHGIEPVKMNEPFFSADCPSLILSTLQRWTEWRSWRAIHASTKATCFPCAAWVGSFVNPSLAQIMGEIIDDECNSKELGFLVGQR